MTEQRLALMDERVMDDPTTHYHELLDQAPFQDPETGLWIVSRYDDVRAILPDTVTYSNRLTLFPHYPLCDEAMAVLGDLQDVPATTAGGDGEVHDRARDAIRATFPTSVRKARNSMGTIVEGRVNELITGLPAAATARGGEADLIHDFSWELPLRVNMDVLGFAPERYEDVKQWSMDQIALTWGRLEPAEQVRAAQGLVNLWRECQAMVAARQELRAQDLPLPEDMTSWLLKLDRLSDDEIASIILNFAVAGHETTANAIGNATYTLLSKPGAWHELAEAAEAGDEQYVANVAEEMLRLHPPIIGWSRFTNEEVTVGGTIIPAGQRILLLLGAANRDGGHYAHPDDLMLGRENDHLAFGLGAHYCVGAPLARLEMTTALGKLARAYPRAELAPGFAERPNKYGANIGFRALKSLPVVLERA
jgi:cytochrome P450